MRHYPAQPSRAARLGKRGEDIANEYLLTRGYEVIERNWRCRAGEIDIVARQGQSLVVVEVKARSSLSAGHPFEAITAAKLARLRSLAGLWCAAQPRAFSSVRIDAIAVIVHAHQPATVEHLTGVWR
jgi:putative endonuclease